MLWNQLREPFWCYSITNAICTQIDVRSFDLPKNSIFIFINDG